MLKHAFCEVWRGPGARYGHLRNAGAQRRKLEARLDAAGRFGSCHCDVIHLQAIAPLYAAPGTLLDDARFTRCRLGWLGQNNEGLSPAFNGAALAPGKEAELSAGAIFALIATQASAQGRSCRGLASVLAASL